jgi:hypothetical protein
MLLKCEATDSCLFCSQLQQVARHIHVHPVAHRGPPAQGMQPEPGQQSISNASLTLPMAQVTAPALQCVPKLKALKLTPSLGQRILLKLTHLPATCSFKRTSTRSSGTGHTLPIARVKLTPSPQHTHRGPTRTPRPGCALLSCKA